MNKLVLFFVCAVTVGSMYSMEQRQDAVQPYVDEEAVRLCEEHNRVGQEGLAKYAWFQNYAMHHPGVALNLTYNPVAPMNNLHYTKEGVERRIEGWKDLITQVTRLQQDSTEA